MIYITVEIQTSPVALHYSYLQHFIFIFGSELLLVAEQFRKVLNKSLSFLILFLFQNCSVTSNSSDPKRKRKRKENVGDMNTESALENKTSLLL